MINRRRISISCNDKRIEEILELKKELGKYDIELQEWLQHIISKDILDIRMEIITLRRMLEEVQHTMIIQNDF